MCNVFLVPCTVYAQLWYACMLCSVSLCCVTCCTYVHTYVSKCVFVSPSLFHVAFTELQTDMELVYDRSDQHLPFLDFRTFAMRVLFPHDTEHVVLQPLAVSGSSRVAGCREGEEPACTDGRGSLYVVWCISMYVWGRQGEEFV